MNAKALFSRLPRRIVFCFAPSDNAPEHPQDIRMVFGGEPGFVPTGFAARNLADEEMLCELLNALPGITAERRPGKTVPWTSAAAVPGMPARRFHT